MDEKQFKKLYPKKYKVWRLTQLINYGLDGEKLNVNEIKLFWNEIKDQISPDKQKVIEFLVWNKPWHPEPGLQFNRENFLPWLFAKSTSSKISTSPVGQL